jgi:hypothetical protein
MILNFMKTNSLRWIKIGIPGIWPEKLVAVFLAEFRPPGIPVPYAHLRAAEIKWTVVHDAGFTFRLWRFATEFYSSSMQQGVPDFLAPLFIEKC